MLFTAMSFIKANPFEMFAISGNLKGYTYFRK